MAKTSKDEARKKVIEVLNKARAMELQAIAQYMNQHYGLDDMDYGELAADMKLIAIDEMRHAEIFAERIKELDGEPTVDPAAKAVKGQEIDKIFPFDADLEDYTIDEYNRFAEICRENGDYLTQKIFKTIIEEEQSHFNYFDNVNNHIKKLGSSYLGRIAGTSSSTGLSPQGFFIRERGGSD